MKLEVLIPAQRTTLAYTLLSLAHQTKAPARITIRDGGEVSVLSDHAVRFALDVCASVGIEVSSFRAVGPTTAALMRLELLEAAQRSVVVFADDDTYWAPDAVERLWQTFGGSWLPWVQALLFTPNRDHGTADHHLPWESDGSAPAALFTTGTREPRRSAWGSSAALMFVRDNWPKAAAWKDWPADLGGEDGYATRLMGEGRIVPRAVVWHEMSPDARAFTTMRRLRAADAEVLRLREQLREG